MKKSTFLFLCLTLLLAGCGKPSPRYHIGISQCSDDEWRQKMNNEIRREAMSYPDVSIEIRTARDNNQLQIQDIEYFIQQKVDLLIVTPNEAVPITPVVEKAFDQGIPVIIADRKIMSDKYTAFVGADNYEIGRDVGNYVASRLGGKGNVVEITGLVGSTPAIERHQGFVNALKQYPGIRLLAKQDGGWLQVLGTEAMDSLLSIYPDIDLVYAHNDRMAIGAYLAAARAGRQHNIAFVGIDALPGPEYGIDQVAKRHLDASFLYPTGGDEVFRIGMAILNGLSYPRETILSTAVVDSTNVRITQLQTDHIATQDSKIELLNLQIGTYLTRYANQQLVLYASFIILLLLGCITFIIFRAFRTKNRLNEKLSRRNAEITRQKEQLENQRDQLISLSEQLEEATHAKLVFFTNVSHDFRTPLTLIADPVERLLADESTLNTQQTSLLRIVHKNVNILLRLVNQILDFRKYENGKMELVLAGGDLRQQVQEWNNAFLSVALKKHIRFQFFPLEGADYRLTADWEKLERVYFNLLSNAFKFTPENGKVSVQLSTFRHDETEFLRLQIADTGVGIASDHIDRIFDRFYKVNAHHAGSGIGLALAKVFVELHGGTIQVESTQGSGTLFTVDIPHRMPTTETDNPSDEPDAPATSLVLLPEEEFSQPMEGTLTETDEKHATSLLIIDDNADIREYIRTLFSDKMTILEAADGKSGLQLAFKYVPDLIICDVRMPGIDGLECCKRLKKEMQTSHIPVLLLTACTQDEQRIEGFESGADSYIAKPFNSKVLEARIFNLLENRQRLKSFFGEGASLNKESISEIDKDFVNRFKQLVEENLSNPELNVEELGKSMGMSRVQLYRKIKSLTNYAPNELLRIARLKKAASLLASTDMTISEITYEVGFSSPSYLTKCYKDYFGESPSDFLKRKK